MPILSNASLFCSGKIFSKCFDIRHNHTSIGLRITNQGSGAWPRAEIDICLSSYAPPTEPFSGGAFLPKESAGIETIASLQRDYARVLDYFARFGQQKTGTLVDMIYWERLQGGTVFNAGAIGFGWALDDDPNLSKLLRNMLHHLAGVTARTPYTTRSGSIRQNKPKGL